MAKRGPNPNKAKQYTRGKKGINGKVREREADVIEGIIRREHRSLSQPQIDELIKTDPVILDQIITALSQFTPRTQIIMDLHAEHGITVAYARAMVDCAVEMVSVVSPDFAANLLTSLMLSYQSIIKSIDGELDAAPKGSRADKIRLIRLKNDVLKNLQSLLPQTSIVRAEIDHRIHDEPSVGQKLIELYNISQPIDVIEEEEEIDGEG